MNLVSCELIGGVGNQLFILSTALAYSYNNNREFKYPPSLHEITKNYHKTLFKNFPKAKTTDVFTEVKEEKHQYHPIEKINGNVMLRGYFQSEKYFSKYREKILSLLHFENEE